MHRFIEPYVFAIHKFQIWPLERTRMAMYELLTALYIYTAHITDYIAEIPDTVLAAATAAIITLLGTSISNKHHSKNLKLQLNHSSHEQEKIRLLELRKDTYLNFVDELNNADEFLGSLLATESDSKEYKEGLSGLNRATLRLKVVSTEKTARLCDQILNLYIRNFVELSLDALTIKEMIKNIKNISTQIQSTKNNDQANIDLRKQLDELIQKNKKLVEDFALKAHNQTPECIQLIDEILKEMRDSIYLSDVYQTPISSKAFEQNRKILTDTIDAFYPDRLKRNSQ